MAKKRSSRTIAEATNREIKRARLQRAMEKAAGSWKDEDHPDLKEKGTYQWVRDLRNDKHI